MDQHEMVLAERQDLGDGHVAVLLWDGGAIPYGLLLHHNDGCVVYVSWAHNAHWEDVELWTLISLRPLTLEEAIECPACGDVGYIIDGFWEG